MLLIHHPFTPNVPVPLSTLFNTPLMSRAFKLVYSLTWFFSLKHRPRIRWRTTISLSSWVWTVTNRLIKATIAPHFAHCNIISSSPFSFSKRRYCHTQCLTAIDIVTQWAGIDKPIDRTPVKPLMQCAKACLLLQLWTVEFEPPSLDWRPLAQHKYHSR